MKKRVVIGIDTSNYTTSYAIVTESGGLIANLKRPLPVKEGERGLRHLPAEDPAAQAGDEAGARGVQL